MTWDVKSFLQVLVTAIIVNVLYFGLCGGLMWLVDFRMDSFLAGLIVGGIFGIWIPIISIAYIVHSFVGILKKKIKIR